MQQAKDITSKIISKKDFRKEEVEPGTLAEKFCKFFYPWNEKRFIKCTGGYVCIAPPYTQPGDQICILLGCNTPMVLRQSKHGKFQVVGQCFVLGFNDG